MSDDDDDTIGADPDEPDGTGASMTRTTDGSTPDENRDVGVGTDE